MPQLIITAETGESTSLGLSDETVTIGRRRDNSLCLPHLSVSGYHARVLSDSGCLIIEDLNSTNGTLVNGHKIDRHFLLHSDDIKIGTYALKYSEVYTSTPPRPKELDNVTPIQSVTPIVEPHMAQIVSEVAALRVASGQKSDSLVPLEKPLTTVGKSGGDVGAIAKKETGYYFLPMNAHSQPIKHNGKGVTPRIEIKLAGGDFIEIGGEYLEFVYPYYS